MTLPPDDELRAMLAGATKGPWAVHPMFRNYVIPAGNARKGIGFAEGDAVDLREYAQDIVRTQPNRHGLGDHLITAKLIALAPEASQTVIDQRAIIAAQAATVERLTKDNEALMEFANSVVLEVTGTIGGAK